MKCIPTKLLALTIAAASAASGAGGGAVAARSGQAMAASAQRRSQNQLTITCTDTTQNVLATPLQALKDAIENGLCEVHDTASCSDKKAKEVFLAATTCPSVDFSTNLYNNGAFNTAEFQDVPAPDPAQTPSPAPASTPAPAPDSYVFKVECNDTPNYLNVRVTADLATSIQGEICKFNPTSCLEEGELNKKPVEVAEKSLWCPSEDLKIHHTTKHMVGNSTRFSPVEGEGTDESGVGNGESGVGNGESLNDQNSSPSQNSNPIVTSPPPPPASGHQEESGPLTNAEIAKALGLEVTDSRVATAQEQVKGCDRVNAIQFLTAARSEADIDVFSGAFSGGSREIESEILKINCANRRDGSGSQNSMVNGYKKVRDFGNRAVRGSIIGSSLIAFGATISLGLCVKFGYNSIKSKPRFNPNLAQHTVDAEIGLTGVSQDLQASEHRPSI